MLDNFKITLQSSLKLGWIKEAYVLTKLTNMPPLMQIKVHENACKEIFDISIEKIDITACNDTAAINSEFLSHYAKIPEICLFCLLVKLWAKTTNVINRYNPTEGLTSYGVILMCLYFLM
jgi:DNA polymerase sigma